ncbi:MAG: muraminidase [Akkermansiaceae bacterium]|nr:muraminidase [Akkermansiaceae bacterium]
MPLIPELTPVPGRYTQVGPSPQVAGIPGAAAARAGQQVAQTVGDVFQGGLEMEQRHQRITDDRTKNYARTRVQKALDEHQQFRIQHPDESTWSPDLSDRMKAAREDVFKQPMSPLFKPEMEQNFTGWEQDYQNDTKAAVLTQGVKRARQQSTNTVRAYRQAGDFESARKTIRESQAAGTWSPEEAEADILDLHDEEKQDIKKKQVQGEQTAITEDAAGWLKRADPKKVPEGMDPAAYDNLFSFARSKLSDETAETTKDILDGIALAGQPVTPGSPEQITSPEQIDRLGAGLRPAVREELKQKLGKRLSDAERNSPEHMAKVMGEVTVGLDSYKADSENFDVDYVKMANQIDTLPEGAAKKELQGRLDTVRKGQLEQIRTYADLGKQSIMESYKAGLFGKVDGTGKVSQDVSSLVDAGYLRAQPKLTAAGLSDEQAKAVSELDEGTLKKALRVSMSESEADATAKDLAKDKTDANRAKAFRLLYAAKAGQVSAPPYEQATAKAIFDGSSSFDWFDQEAASTAMTERLSAQDHLGAVLYDYSNFIRAHPDAKPSEIDDHIFQLGGDKLRQRLQQSKLPSASPTGDRGATSNTGAVPVGSTIKDVVKDLEAGGEPGGFYRSAYWDNRQWSIGYGTKSKEGEVIDKAEAEKRLDAELSMHRKRVDEIAEKNGYHFNDAQKDALTSFDFNLGQLEELLVKRGHRSDAEIAEAMRLYRNEEKGGVLVPSKGLQRRRDIEAQIFLNGYRK